MQIKSFAATFSICFLSACGNSSPPPLPEPKGEFLPVNAAPVSSLSRRTVESVQASNLHVNSNAVKPTSIPTVKPLPSNPSVIPPVKSPPSEVKIPVKAVVPANSGATKQINPSSPKMLTGFIEPKILPPLASTHGTEKLLPPVKTSPPTTATVKPILIKPTLLPPPKIWRMNAGSTLKETFTKWAADEKCNFSQSWSVKWNTQTDYPIDSPLTFSGSFEDVTIKLFSLYKNAETPLYADGYKSQCIVVVSNKK